MTSALEVKNVSKLFGNLRAVDDVSFGVDDESLTILIGPNGSGKTTLINIISGFYKPDEGRVVYNGEEITGLAPHKVYTKGVARTFQIPSLFWKMTVLENVMVAKRGHSGEGFARSVIKSRWKNEEELTAEEAFRVLEIVGLSKFWDQTALSLSGGQMKLLEVGRVLMSGAKTILMDEPISGVNPTLAHDIFSKLQEIRKDYGITFLIVEHRLDIALGYVDRAIAMSYGKLVTVGSPDEVMADPRVVEAYLGA